MRTSAILSTGFLLLGLCQAGCSGRSENQVIQGSGDEVTSEMITTEEEELETKR
jgi:hypothetical protein